MSGLVRDQIRERVRHHRNVKKQLEQMRSRENAFIYIDENSNDSNDSECDLSMNDKLKQWAIEYNVSHRAITALLKILISIGMTWLPSDARSLLKTPRVIQLTDCAGGKLWYRSIETNLISIFKNITNSIEISLNFNFDGAVLYKSSLWPILANIEGKYFSENRNAVSYSSYYFVYCRYAEYSTNGNRCMVRIEQT